MPAIDWSDIYTKYKGKWVALEDDERTVISSGKTAKIAHEKALKKGFDNPILMRVPTDLMPFIGFGS
jgi:hypothetical protein